jgi:hypothetical protein
MGLGPTTFHPRGLPPSQGRAVPALRPAWASWMPGTAPASRMRRASSARPATCSSDQMPRSKGLILPSGRTAVASTITSPTPPRARVG